MKARSATLVAVLGLVVACKGWLSARWGLLADEAYHWTWSLQPALGYYDQPPAIAWLLAAARTAGGDTGLALRLPAIACGVVVFAALAPHARDRGLWTLWALGLPPLALLTTLAVPDAPLLAGWAVALSGAIAGGPVGWTVAAVGALVASLSKHTGLLVLPLLLVGASPQERRTPWPWVALGILALGLAPHLVWLVRHDWVTVGFQLEEGLAHPAPPGLAGPLVQLRDQGLVVTPLAWVAGVWWLVRHAGEGVRGEADPVVRLAWWSSAPVLVAFALAAVGGPPEAHWPAPAWIGVGLGLARTAEGRLATWAWSGAWLAAGLSAAVALHGVRPLVPLVQDPAVRVTEGPALADAVARWVLPVGVAPREPGVRGAGAVYTERYQEAALIHFYTGIPARPWPGCGRRSQYDLTGAPDAAASAWFVRPTTSGPPDCVVPAWAVGARHGLRPIDAHGRRPGPWDLFELEAR